MRVHLDTASEVAEAYRAGGRSVRGLAWENDATSSEGRIVDRVAAVPGEGRTLFAGTLRDVVANSGQLPGGLAVATPGRFEPGILALKQSNEAGELGELGLLRAHRWMAGPADEAAREESLLAAVDVALWLFGQSPFEVYAVARDEPATLQIHFGFPGNGMALLDMAWGLPQGGGYESLHLIGDRGAAYADDHHNVSLLYGGDEPRALCVENTPVVTGALLNAFVTGSSSLASVGDICLAQQVVTAALKSCETGQATSLQTPGTSGGGV